jgi:hypothetical protein
MLQQGVLDVVGLAVLLRERAGISDTGKFNYHLTQLCEYFVRDTGEGYELGHAGTRLIGVTKSGHGGSGSERLAEAVFDGGVTRPIVSQ